MKMRAKTILADIKYFSRLGGGIWWSCSFSGFSSKTNCSALSVEISPAVGGLSSCVGKWWSCSCLGFWSKSNCSTFKLSVEISSAESVLSSCGGNWWSRSLPGFLEQIQLFYIVNRDFISGRWIELVWGRLMNPFLLGFLEQKGRLFCQCNVGRKSISGRWVEFVLRGSYKSHDDNRYPQSVPLLSLLWIARQCFFLLFCTRVKRQIL